LCIVPFWAALIQRSILIILNSTLTSHLQNVIICHHPESPGPRW
jgi:hypothetical protein